MDEQRKKQMRDAYLAYDGGTQSHSWWQLGLRIPRRNRIATRWPDERSDWRERDRHNANRMRIALGLNGLHFDDLPPRSRRDDFR